MKMKRQIILKSRPVGLTVPENFEIREITLPELSNGQVRLTPHTFSVDPYLRGRMNDGPSYIAPFQVGEPIVGGGIARVTESLAEGFKVGEYVSGYMPWQEEIILDSAGLNIVNESIAPLSYYLGVLGMPGLTAYFSLLGIGNLKKGETIVISGAAGAVGIVAGQLAKIAGCRVVGITGGDDKVNYLLNEINLDVAINYKTCRDLSTAVEAACPSGVDVYFDNVGGEISDVVINKINKFARIIICGQISLYNVTSPPAGPRIQGLLLKRSALMQGFLINNYTSKFTEGVQALSLLVKNGELKYTNTTYFGFEKLPEAFLALFEGKNLGKLIVEL